MKNKLTLFEKIWATLGILNSMLFVVGILVICVHEDLNETFNFHSVGCILFFPFLVYILSTLLLLIIVEIILGRVWGLNVHTFPALFEEEENT